MAGQAMNGDKTDDIRDWRLSDGGRRDKTIALKEEDRSTINTAKCLRSSL